MYKVSKYGALTNKLRLQFLVFNHMELAQLIKFTVFTICIKEAFHCDITIDDLVVSVMFLFTVMYCNNPALYRVYAINCYFLNLLVIDYYLKYFLFKVN